MPPDPASDTVEIVRIAGGNIARLGNVAADVFDRDIDRRLTAQWLASPDVLLVVAIAAGLVVGQVQAAILHHPDQPSELYVDNLGVAPAWQRRGIATALVDRLSDLARARGCAGLWVLTEPDNDAARGFYAARSLSPLPAVLYAGQL